ncbi:hypothetical protein FGF62_09440 [Neisseria meningitidis]|nr:hypothetical protein [Neisseria meningitidis]
MCYKAVGSFSSGRDVLKYSGLNLNQDKATKPQTVQIVRQGEATPYWFLLIGRYGKRVGQRKRTIRPYGQRLLDCVA